jgi:hypothetical protein
VCKEAGLIWLTWHCVVAVNKWRGRVNVKISQACKVCNTGAMESTLHRFWECESARKAWTWGLHILQIALQYQAQGYRDNLRRSMNARGRRGVVSI